MKFRRANPLVRRRAANPNSSPGNGGNGEKPQLPRAPQLLQKRQDTARQLSCSTMTIVRLEAAGKLRAIKLSDSPKARVFHLCDEVRQLVEVQSSSEARAQAAQAQTPHSRRRP
jgi:hypothetical protein